MPLFRAYFEPEIFGNFPLEVDLGLTSDALVAFIERAERERSESLVGNIDFRVTQIVAMEPFFMGSVAIREGDIVWRVWPEREPAQSSPTDYRKLIEAYKPVWEPGPGWLKVRQKYYLDVVLR